MPIFALLGGIALFAVHRRRQPSDRAPHQGARGVDDVRRPGGDSAVHARRLLVRRRQVVRAAAARAPGAVWLGAGRHRDRRRVAVRVLHAVHRRVGRDDPRARRPAAAGPAEGRLSRAIFDRAPHRVRVARPAVSAVTAADAVRHRCAGHRDRRPVHRRLAAGIVHARAPVDHGHARRHSQRRTASAVSQQGSGRRRLGGQVGADAPDRHSRS